MALPGLSWRDCSLVACLCCFIPSCGFLWDGQFDMNRVLVLTGVIAFIFLLRILIYSYGYTKAQIGGAKVSKNIRLFMGDHLKRIPLSRFTQGQTGDYINTITSDVNNYEKNSDP